jgi:hypothetical protein
MGKPSRRRRSAYRIVADLGGGFQFSLWKEPACKPKGPKMGASALVVDRPSPLMSARFGLHGRRAQPRVVCSIRI